MERDELRERIAQALYEDAHRHQEPEHFYPWEQVRVTTVAKGYHRQADAVLAALSDAPMSDALREKHDMADAPPWYCADEASAWLSGWNAAVAAALSDAPAPTEWRACSCPMGLSPTCAIHGYDDDSLTKTEPAPTVEYEQVDAWLVDGGHRVTMQPRSTEWAEAVPVYVKREPAPRHRGDCPAHPKFNPRPGECTCREPAATEGGE